MPRQWKFRFWVLLANFPSKGHFVQSVKYLYLRSRKFVHKGKDSVGAAARKFLIRVHLANFLLKGTSWFCRHQGLRFVTDSMASASLRLDFHLGPLEDLLVATGKKPLCMRNRTVRGGANLESVWAGVSTLCSWKCWELFCGALLVNLQSGDCGHCSAS